MYRYIYLFIDKLTSQCQVTLLNFIVNMINPSKTSYLLTCYYSGTTFVMLCEFLPHSVKVMDIVLVKCVLLFQKTHKFSIFLFWKFSERFPLERDVENILPFTTIVTLADNT